MHRAKVDAARAARSSDEGVSLAHETLRHLRPDLLRDPSADVPPTTDDVVIDMLEDEELLLLVLRVGESWRNCLFFPCLICVNNCLKCGCIKDGAVLSFPASPIVSCVVDALYHALIKARWTRVLESGVADGVLGRARPGSVASLLELGS